jgi:predicted RNA binding protein YcfA (HicA-like mRNA interferase family)
VGSRHREFRAAIAGSSHTTDPSRKVTVPIHGSTDLKRGTLRSIITQAGLTVAEFTALS